MSEESELDQLFQRYRRSCPEPEPSPHFMPALWQKIEARHSFPFLFRQWGRSVAAASAALCLLLLALNLAAPPISVSYADALLAEGSAEQTDYTEAMAVAPAAVDVSPSPHR